MTYDPYRPPGQGYPWQPPAPRTSGGGLVAIGVVALLLLLAELGILGYDISQQGVEYLPVALGFTYDHAAFRAPVGFFGYDAALSVALLALVIGAFSRRSWVRPGAVVLLAVNGYAAAAMTINQLGTSYGRDAFARSPAFLLLNVAHLLSVAAAVIVAVVVAATRPTGPSGAPAAAAAPNPYAPYPAYGAYDRPASPPLPAQASQPSQPFQPFQSPQPARPPQPSQPPVPPVPPVGPPSV
ncbi:hypothetical protein [Kitasatospora sp. NPDC057223]|uniref:hypothetical protein n=1 Tax=Kitasatospora sp. NPDC057223 TaxID=3346055 RepID=UPI00363D2594